MRSESPPHTGANANCSTEYSEPNSPPNSACTRNSAFCGEPAKRLRLSRQAPDQAARPLEREVVVEHRREQREDDREARQVEERRSGTRSRARRAASGERRGGLARRTLYARCGGRRMPRPELSDAALARLPHAPAASPRARARSRCRRRARRRPRALARLRGRRGLAALDSAAGEPRRWSLLAFDPLAARAAGAGRLRSRDLRALSRGSRRRRATTCRAPSAAASSARSPTTSGVRGRAPLALPAGAVGPAARVGGLYVDFVVRDERRGARAGSCWARSPATGAPSVERAARGAARAPARARERPRARRGAAAPRPARAPHAAPRSTAAHRARARELIAAGRDLPGEPRAPLHARGRAAIRSTCTRACARVNPAPYMAVRSRGVERAGCGAPAARCSRASPELLLELAEDGGALARTRPIKGTAPRAPRTRARTARAPRALLASAKDRGRAGDDRRPRAQRPRPRRAARAACASSALPRLESYARVHHLVGRRRRAARGPASTRSTCSPRSSRAARSPARRSSRAMDAIAALEGEGRGFFTGSLGFLDTRGRAASTC